MSGVFQAERGGRIRGTEKGSVSGAEVRRIYVEIGDRNGRDSAIFDGPD